MKKAGVFLLALFAIPALCFASGTNEKSGAATTTNVPLVTIQTVLYYPTAPSSGNPVQKAIESYTHTRLKISWVPSSAYDTKVSTEIAAGTLPEVLTVRHWKVPSVINAVQSGEFWNITSEVPQFNHLKAFPKQVFSNVTINGKIYGIPRRRPLARGGILLRKDWLENVGMKMPHSISALYNVIKAFTLDDPNKDGKNDTVGFLMNKRLIGFNQLVAYFGGPNQWRVKNGTFTPWFETDGYRSAMTFVKKLYDQHLMNRDFPAITGSQMTDYMNSGKGGMYINVVDDATSHFNPLFEAHPNVKHSDLIGIVQRIKGPDGYRLAATTGYNGLLMFPKTSIKNKRELHSILHFVNKLGDKKMISLLNYGIQGKTYKLENGKAVVTNAKLFNTIGNPYRQIKPFADTNKIPGVVSPLTAEFLKMEQRDLPIAVANPANPLISKTYNQNGSQLDLMIQNATVKYIVGDIGQRGFDNVIKKWKAEGGTKVIHEYEAAYAQSHS